VNLTFLYVALLYGCAVVLCRRWGFSFPWRYAAFFYLLTLLFLFRPLVGPWVSSPADYIFALPPWMDFRRPLNPELNDIALQMVPWTNLVRESWRSLHAPLWNAAAGSGYPLLANGQSAGLSVYRLLLLPIPLAESLAAEAALKILTALSFSFLYMRRRGFSEEASSFTAVAFGFSSFITVWLHFPHTTVAVLLPATFFAIDLLLERTSAGRIAFCAIVMSFLLLNGHPETAAHVVFASAMYVGFRLIAAPDMWALRGVLAVIGGGVLAIVLALPFELPFLESLPRSQRLEAVSASPDLIKRLDNNAIIPFFQNQYFGTRQQRNLWGPGIAEFISGSVGIFGFAAWVAALFDLIRRRRWRHVSSFFVLFTPVVVAIAMGWPVISDVFHKLPLFSLAANGRLRLVYCWFAAVIAGTVLESSLIEKRRHLLAITGAVGALLLVAAFVTNPPPEPRLLENARVTTILPGLVLLTSFLFGSWKKLRPSIAAILLISFTVAELWSQGRKWNPIIPRSEFYPKTPLIEFLQKKSAIARREGRQFRIVGRDAAFFPNLAGMYGLEDIRAHDPMAFGRYLGALRVFTGYTSAEYFGMLSKFDSPFIDYLNVRYVLSSRNEELISPKLVEVYKGTDGRVYENLKVQPRFFAAQRVLVEFDDAKRMSRIVANQDWKSTVVLKRLPTWLVETIRHDVLGEQSPERPLASVRVVQRRGDDYLLHVDAPRWTMVVSSVPLYPGWQITRNGSEALKIIEVNEAFIGFLVPPGKSTIVAEYSPRSFRAGLWISLTTLAILLASVVWSGIRGRREQRQRVPV